ncbi:MarR family winged helix-turn-helix transcriptional regulator [Streptomyces triticiradicis]|uniref:MarR family transcriptional regulator n=1 Tax=Streptomyces triticiradicis TaxID=2651189 RepID=A0A7J5DML8_9ACTN|nr:MarR family transcriptional regulator [Streptomyces triticiradicis]KAB1989915.1 MarR family transcriptional regulator [Streptomyces triticiradicis]
MDQSGERPDGTAVSESAARAAQDLRVAFSLLRRRIREVPGTQDRAQDLTPSQISALTLVSKSGAATASALAAAEGVRPQSMAATLAALDRYGLIQRNPDPGDGRRQLVTLTDAGRERVEGTRQARSEWLARAFEERCTEDERRTVIEAMALLERLTRS